MGSSRFPGKILELINNKPQLVFQYERLTKSKLADKVVVATSESYKDNLVEKLCITNDIQFYRGSEEDVLDRYYKASLCFKADLIIRCNADCPFIDPDIVDKVINAWHSLDNIDYASNILEETFPLGMHTEVFSLGALKRAFDNAKGSDEREHVTPYIYRNPDKFKLVNLKNKEDLSHHRWTVDYKEDLEFINKVVEHLDDKKDTFTMMDVVKLLEIKPEIQAINSKYKKSQNLL